MRLGLFRGIGLDKEVETRFWLAAVMAGCCPLKRLGLRLLTCGKVVVGGGMLAAPSLGLGVLIGAV